VVGLLRIAQEQDLHVLIRGSGCAVPASEGRAPEHFTREEFTAFWGRVLSENGITRRPQLLYLLYHDRAGAIRRDGQYRFGIARKSLRGFRCWRIDRGLHVLYNGDVVICCNDYHREVVLGNLREQSIAEVFRSERYREVRRQVLGLAESPSDFICKRCSKPGG
jgi:hypothetical protein